MCVLVKVGVPQNLKVDRQFPNVAPIVIRYRNRQFDNIRYTVSICFQLVAQISDSNFPDFDLFSLGYPSSTGHMISSLWCDCSKLNWQWGRNETPGAFVLQRSSFLQEQKNDTQINVSLEGLGIFVISHAETNGFVRNTCFGWIITQCHKNLNRFYSFHQRFNRCCDQRSGRIGCSFSQNWIYFSQPFGTDCHGLPSGKHTKTYGNSPFLMGKST
jgi:hypothetical protein